MSDDQLSSELSAGLPRRPDLLGLEPEQIEAARLAEILADTEQGHTIDLDPIEDPSLASLSTTAHSLRRSLESATARASFDAFHANSRSRVMAATPRPRREPVIPEAGESLLQRWNGLFTSIASAAAAAVATFVVTVLAIGGSSAPAPLASVQVAEPASTPDASAPQVSAVPIAAPPEQARVNLTALSITEQVSVYVGLLERLDALNLGGEPADENLLRDLADTSATVKRTIKADPDVSGAAAFLAMRATFEGQQALQTATVASDEDLQVLITAQETAGDAYVTAAQFLGNSDELPTAEEVAALDEETRGTDEPELPFEVEDTP